METETTTITAQELNKNDDKVKKSKKKLMVNLDFSELIINVYMYLLLKYIILFKSTINLKCFKIVNLVNDFFKFSNI